MDLNEKKYKLKKNYLEYFTAEPTPSKKELNDYYKEKYFKNCPSYSYEKNEDELNLENLDSLIKLQSILEAHNYSKYCPEIEPKERINLFEIGSGEGHFLNFFKSINLFNVCGIDFSTAQNKYNFEKDIIFLSSDDPINKFIKDFSYKTDVLVLNHVFEHVPDPEQLLSNLKNVLKKDCLIMITVPNDFSKLQEYLKNKDLLSREYWISPPEHLNYFNVKTMYKLFGKYCFEVIDLFGDFPIEMLNLNEFTNYSLNPQVGKESHKLRCKTATFLIESESDPNDLLNLSRSLARCNLSRSITYLCKAQKLLNS